MQGLWGGQVGNRDESTVRHSGFVRRLRMALGGQPETLHARSSVLALVSLSTPLPPCEGARGSCERSNACVFHGATRLDNGVVTSRSCHHLERGIQHGYALAVEPPHAQVASHSRRAGSARTCAPKCRWRADRPAHRRDGAVRLSFFQSRGARTPTRRATRESALSETWWNQPSGSVKAKSRAPMNSPRSPRSRRPIDPLPPPVSLRSSASFGFLRRVWCVCDGAVRGVRVTSQIVAALRRSPPVLRRVTNEPESCGVLRSAAEPGNTMVCAR
jgi:hypothetical protein